MMVRSIMLLICIVFSQGFAGSKDLWVKKCEQWKDAAKAQSTLSYELIDDQSVLAKSSTQKKFSKIRLSNDFKSFLFQIFLWKSLLHHYPLEREHGMIQKNT